MASNRSRLPFEPTKSNKKTPPLLAPAQLISNQPEPDAPVATQIPAVVSQRMVRRMTFLCGVPTGLGLLAFPLSHLVSHQWFKLPVSVVLFTTLGLFILGALGLSYGIFSASWEEDQPGTRLGWSEFQLNFGRIREGWRSRQSDS